MLQGALVKLIHRGPHGRGHDPLGERGQFHRSTRTATRGLFIVADGMGGHAAGEVASEMAVQIVSARARRTCATSTATASRERVADVAEDGEPRDPRAHDHRSRTSRGWGRRRRCSMLAGSRYLIGQVGDSRVYLLRDGKLEQLTKDHSYVQEQVDAGYPHAGAGALPSVQQRDHAVRRRERATWSRTSIAAKCAPGTSSSSRATASPAWSTTAASQQLLLLARAARAQGAGADLRGERSRWAGQHHGDRRAGRRDRSAGPTIGESHGGRWGRLADETVGSLAELYLGNILYALELAALSLERNRARPTRRRSTAGSAASSPRRMGARRPSPRRGARLQRRAMPRATILARAASRTSDAGSRGEACDRFSRSPGPAGRRRRAASAPIR